MKTLKELKFNRESLYSATIYYLQNKYNEYKKLMIKYLENTCIDNNGDFYIVDGIDKIYKRAKEIDNEFNRLIILRNLLRSDASDAEILHELNK